MLKLFENWLLEQNYTANTTFDYQGRIERLCKKERFGIEHLIQNIATILPDYERTCKKSSYGKRSHTSVLQALRRFQAFISLELAGKNG